MNFVQGLPKLKYLNLSRTSEMRGGFLRFIIYVVQGNVNDDFSLGKISYSCDFLSLLMVRHVSDRRRGSLLETIILRECCSLDEVNEFNIIV